MERKQLRPDIDRTDVVFADEGLENKGMKTEEQGNLDTEETEGYNENINSEEPEKRLTESPSQLSETFYKELEQALSGESEENDSWSDGAEGDERSFKFSEMTESDIDKIAEGYRKKAPIKIPDDAKYKAKSMADGYEQISYKWSDGIYKYEIRWHTRTSSAPEGQGNTWVIQRIIPGNGGTKPSTQFLIGKNEWIEGWKWYDAINARKNGTATHEQIELLNKGHWKE